MLAKYVIISWSGGMDSTALVLKKLVEGYTVYTFGFDYGQKHIIELQKVQDNIQYFANHNIRVLNNVVDLRSMFAGIESSLMLGGDDIPEGYYEEDNMKQTVVPNRNGIFASILYSHALSLYKKLQAPIEIALGVHSGDHAIYPDCRQEFYEQLMTAFTTGNWDSEHVSLSLPYLHLDKADILQDAILNCAQLNLDFDTVFRNTNTSYDPNPDGSSNGRTGSDTERVLAFHSIGRKDPVAYSIPWEEVLAYALSSKNKFERS